MGSTSLTFDKRQNLFDTKITNLALNIQSKLDAFQRYKVKSFYVAQN